MAVSPTSLSAWRDLLLPGLWAMNGKGGPEVDMQIDFASDALIISANGMSEVLFTLAEIEDNLYRTEFAPRVESLKVKADVKYIPYGG